MPPKSGGCGLEKPAQSRLGNVCAFSYTTINRGAILMSPNRRMLLQTMRIAPCFSTVENKRPTQPPQPASAGFHLPVPEQKHAIPPESIWRTVDVSINMRCLRHRVVGKSIYF